MNQAIYMDYAATTPIDGRVLKLMSRYMGIEGVFGNPASRSHPYGWDSEKLIDEAKKAGCKNSQLMHSEKEIPFHEIENSDTIGISSGASAPENLVQPLLTNIKKDNSLTVRYYSISELASESNDIQKIKVGGYIKPNSIQISEDDQLEVSFFVFK